MLVSLLNGEIEEKEYLIINNARVLYKKLPSKIYGFIYEHRGLNIIVINWNISKEKKKRTIIHELAHLELHHLDKKKELLEFSVEDIEDEADKYVDYLINNQL